MARFSRNLAIVFTLGTALVTACNAESPRAHAECAGPDQDQVDTAVAGIPRLRDDLPWHADKQGHTGDCTLFWVLLDAHGTVSTPSQLMFFRGSDFAGTATPEPGPYLSVIDSGSDVVTVQYKWIVGDEPNCCPTGNATVRFQLTPQGHVEARDPLPAN